jgi:23S rRNA (uracil1939-C5)-methyltransferase
MWDVENQMLVDVGPCPAASAPLRAFLQWLRADPPSIDRASLRLRVDPDGTRGLWIDAANVDVKTLMDDGAWLRRLLAAGVVVEIGQRRKPLYADPEDGRLRLHKEVELRPWFRTWVGGRALPLYGPVGGFSQPSLAANRLLVERVVALCEATGARRWIELGAGNGNLTLPLAGTGAEVTALELDGTAREGLERSAAEAGLAVEIVAADVHRAAGLGPLIDATEAVLADPPRSGLRGFVDALAAREQRPAHLIYVSCHADSLVADAARLAAIGYAPLQVEGVDQFPQSPHIEWLVRFALSTHPAAD